MSLKIESLPINFDGWLNFYELKPKDGDKPAAKRGDTDEAIPF